MGAVYLSHIGVCVSDLARSLRFYCEGLGFEEIHRLHVDGEPAAQLLETASELSLDAVYLLRDGVRIELLYYERPGHVGDAKPRPMNALGLTHLSLRVQDLDGTVADLERLGAITLAHTRIENPDYGATVVFVTDPDGTRIELVESHGNPAAPPGD